MSNSKQAIKILSIKQPYASWIVYGSKFCENRTWPTKHRGELYIHASSWDSAAGAGNHEYYDYPVPVGCIIGRVNLLTCRTAEQVEDAKFSFIEDDDEINTALEILSKEPRNFFGGWDTVEGPNCFLMSDRQPLAVPIPASGKLQIWTNEIPEELLVFSGAGCQSQPVRVPES